MATGHSCLPFLSSATIPYYFKHYLKSNTNTTMTFPKPEKASNEIGSLLGTVINSDDVKMHPSKAKELDALLHECDQLIDQMHHHVIKIMNITRSHTSKYEKGA